MSFGKKLEGLFNQGRAKVEERIAHHNAGGSHGHQQQDYPGNTAQAPMNNNGPPPVPYGSKPGQGGSAAENYWQPHFDYQAVEVNFRHETGAHGWGNNELQNYTNSPNNSFNNDHGELVIRAIANAQAPNDKYTSARLTSHQTLLRDKGYLSVRLTPPIASGIWPAFWLLPQDPFNWPTDGEVDIFESWNGDRVNHSCLHWGHFNGEDSQKHRVIETHIPDMDRPGGIVYGFAWDQPENGQGGRMVWYIDGRPAMKANIPAGTRKMREFRLIINVAVGGNVCNGQVPRDGNYDLVLHEMKLESEPAGGWRGFDEAFGRAAEGHAS